MAMDSQDKIKFWTILCSIMLAVSVLVMLIDMSIKTAILEESAHLRRVILGEREGQQPIDTTGNSEYNLDTSVPPNLLVPTDTGMGEASSDNGHKTPNPTRRATRPVQARDPEIPPGN